MAQAGEYYCRATNENGAIKSKPATLSVIGELLYNRQKKQFLPVYCCFVHLGISFYLKRSSWAFMQPKSWIPHDPSASWLLPEPVELILLWRRKMPHRNMQRPAGQRYSMQRLHIFLLWGVQNGRETDNMPRLPVTYDGGHPMWLQKMCGNKDNSSWACSCSRYRRALKVWTHLYGWCKD